VAWAVKDETEVAVKDETVVDDSMIIDEREDVAGRTIDRPNPVLVCKKPRSPCNKGDFSAVMTTM